MSYSPSSPVTGGAQTGLTSPTYTIAAAASPDGAYGVQRVVTALGGTQTGVTVHTPSSPFLVNFVGPKQFQLLGAPDANGIIRRVPRNKWKLVALKGVTPASGQLVVPMQGTVSLEVPSGAETYDSANVRAMISLLIGLLNQVSAGLGDTVVSGVV